MSLEEIFYRDFITPSTKKEVENIHTSGFEEDPLIEDEIKFLSMEDFVEPSDTSFHEPLQVALYQEDEENA
jgi:hypothetical protein